jgi:hypothetical protein
MIHLVNFTKEKQYLYNLKIKEILFFQPVSKRKETII